MYLAPARKEKTCVYLLPHTRAARYLNREWKVLGNRGTPVLGKFFLIQWNFEGLIIY